MLSNDDLAHIVETNDEWISARTGIKRRHVLSQGEHLIDYAIESARKALEMSGTAASEVDMVLLATSSPDDIFGSATQVLTCALLVRLVAVHHMRVHGETLSSRPYTVATHSNTR